jgi:hypothetical protein
MVKENTMGEEVFRKAAAKAAGESDSEWEDASDEDE